MKRILKTENISLIFSIIAVVFTAFTWYYQTFFKSYDVRVSTFGQRVFCDSNKIYANIIVNNEGNTYSTITQCYLLFYQKGKNDWDKINEGVVFGDSNEMLIEHMDKPICTFGIGPNDHKYKRLIQNMYWEKVDSMNIDFKKWLKIALVFSFINEDGLNTSKVIDIGWYHLDENRKCSGVLFYDNSDYLFGNGQFSKDSVAFNRKMRMNFKNAMDEGLIY
jgi:hypothetical protein